ncbi:MAG TPA: molybdenum cofactor biosynthesis protein [Paenibacillaceae bacterium]|nr:molybdenum cofactor biosynthesis protein [Paenibacillaceae bacterium]
MLKKHCNGSRERVKCAIITVSDTRVVETDASGKLIHELLEKVQHQVCHYEIIPDDKHKILQTVEVLLNNGSIEAIILNGGTGIAKRDVTIEAISPLLEKELPGFGELFRYLSYEEDVGSASLLSRAIAGVANQTVIFSLPGSTGAVKLAMEKLILPELGHIVSELNK